MAETLRQTQRADTPRAKRPAQESPLRSALVPGRPALRLFTVILTPLALAVSLATLIGLVALGYESSPLTLAWYTALPLSSAAAGLLVVTALVCLTPLPLFNSPRLPVALGASYFPYLGGAVMAVSVALWAINPLLEGLQPSQEAKQGITGSPGIALGIAGWYAGLWGLAGWLSNRIRTLRGRARHYSVELADRLSELEESRRRIVSLEESVRRDIASYLHGSVQSKLILLIHQLDALEQNAAFGAIAAELGALRREFGESLHKDISALSHQLYPSVLRIGLVPALESLVDRIASALQVTVEIDKEFSRREAADRQLVDERVKLAAYRFAEEALNNAVKHAEAGRATLRLDLVPDGCFRITVTDDGIGFDVSSVSGGMGTAVMHDYTAAVGGECAVLSARGHGVTAAATLPLATSGADAPVAA